MTRALVTKLVEALVKSTGELHRYYSRHDDMQLVINHKAIQAAREYLATEPSGERSELTQALRTLRMYAQSPHGIKLLTKAADMLEADAQQAKRVPMTGEEIAEIALDFCLPQSTRSFARAIEAHHGITPADKPADDESEDLYALALKADNWGQPLKIMRPSSPCIAVCSTAQGDDLCKGCGRTLPEVCLWLEMNDEQREAVWKRIEAERTAWRYTKYKERAK